MSRRLKLQALWAVGQVIADIAKLITIAGQALVRAGNRLQDWADRR